MRETSSSDAKDVVLHSIGRNVLNLQKMEGMFKSLAIYSEISGPIEELPALIAARKDEFSRKSLGQLVGDFIDRLAVELPDHLEDRQTDLPWIEFRSALLESDDSKARLENALATLVAERNSLIHQKLLSFEIDSEEQCSTLLSELDAQHERIRPAYGYLLERVNALNEMKVEIQEKIASKLGGLDL